MDHKAYFDGLSSEHKEVLSAHHHKAHKLLAEDSLHLISLDRGHRSAAASIVHLPRPSQRLELAPQNNYLLNTNADSHRVDRWLNKYLLLCRAADCDGVHKQFFALPIEVKERQQRPNMMRGMSFDRKSKK